MGEAPSSSCHCHEEGECAWDDCNERHSVSSLLHRPMDEGAWGQGQGTTLTTSTTACHCSALSNG